MGKERLGLLRPQEMHVEPKTLGRGGGPFVFEHAVLGGRDAQAADPLPVDRLAGFLLQCVIERDREPEHACDIARRTKLPDHAGGVPRGAMGETGFFE